MQSLLHAKLLVFTAHPDDECYTCAGTLYKNSRNGSESVLVCSTLGGHGNAFLKKPLPITQVKKIRKGELMRQAKFLGISKVFALDLADGKVSDHQREVLRRGLTIAARCRPDFILSFGKDGLSGHKDHIAVGRAAKAIAKKTGIPFLAFSVPPEFRRTAERYLRGLRKSSGYIKHVSLAREDIRIKVSPAVKRKSLDLYASQKGPGKNPFAELEYECFTES